MGTRTYWHEGTPFLVYEESESHVRIARGGIEAYVIVNADAEQEEPYVYDVWKPKGTAPPVAEVLVFHKRASSIRQAFTEACETMEAALQEEETARKPETTIKELGRGLAKWMREHCTE